MLQHRIRNWSGGLLLAAATLPFDPNASLADPATNPLNDVQTELAWRSREARRSRRVERRREPIVLADWRWRDREREREQERDRERDRERERRRWRRFDDSPPFDTYFIAKGGGLHVTDPGTDGMYLGAELGGSAANVLDLGFSVDWFHRQTRDLRVLFETEGGYQFPIRGEITEFESSADLVPLGVTMRVRLPMASAPVQPFVSGTLAYEILHLGLFELNPQPRPYDNILGDSETFGGFAWQAAAGVQVALAPAIALVGEAGLHRGTPTQAVEIDGAPVDLRVRLNGGFLRAGLRIGL